jgi:enoyl-[acyl-carrier-protein] reductase (NADH)
MKVVYGTPKTVMAVGMAEVGELSTPFVAFVDKAKVDADPDMMSVFGASNSIVDKIDGMGGVVVYFDNKDAAKQFMTMTAMLFQSAMDTDWYEVEEMDDTVQ